MRDQRDDGDPAASPAASARTNRRSSVGVAARWIARGRHVIDAAAGRTWHRRVVGELVLLRRSVEDMRKQQRRLEANLQAEFQLRDVLTATESGQAAAAITPFNPGWQLSSQAMLQVVHHVLLDRPEVVVECGSGASTMWIGRALRRVGEGRVIALENWAEWVAIVTGLLEQEGLSRADVRHAPIEQIRVAEHGQPWYSPSALADVNEIDLLLVDGPPRRTSKLARYPAVPALRDKLRPGATVMLDDCHRRDEKEILRRWLAEVSELSMVRRFDNLAVMKIN